MAGLIPYNLSIWEPLKKEARRRFSRINVLLIIFSVIVLMPFSLLIEFWVLLVLAFFMVILVICVLEPIRIQYFKKEYAQVGSIVIYEDCLLLRLNNNESIFTFDDIMEINFVLGPVEGDPILRTGFFMTHGGYDSTISVETENEKYQYIICRTELNYNRINMLYAYLKSKNLMVRKSSPIMMTFGY